MRDLDVWMRETCRYQHTLLSLDQVRATGATPAEIQHRLTRGDWERLSRNVIALAGGPHSPLRDLKALTLDGGPGTVIAASSGSALWRLPGFRHNGAEGRRLRETGHRRVELGTIRQTRYLPDHHVTTVAGIEVLTLPRVIFDLAGTHMHPDRLARIVDTVTGRSPALLRSLHLMLGELAASGRNGITVMREILDARPIGYLPPASNLERRFEKILEDAGEPPMRRQVNLGGHEWIGRVDYADDPPLFVAEIQSQTYHSSLLDKAADELRFKRLKEETGVLEILAVPEESVWHCPADVLRDVRRCRALVARHLKAAS